MPKYGKLLMNRFFQKRRYVKIFSVVIQENKVFTDSVEPIHFI